MIGGITCIPIPGKRNQPHDSARAQFDLPNFVCGPENRLARLVLEQLLAHAATGNDQTTDIRLPIPTDAATRHSPLSVPNPVVFTGPTGCGKTHVISGIAAHWQAQFGKNTALYVTAVDFARQFLDADDPVTQTAVRNSLRNLSLLAIDDIDRLPRRSAIGEELINVIDAINRQGGLLLIGSTNPPRQLPDLLPGLQSRLCQGLILPLALPGRAARRELARSLCGRRGMTLSRARLDMIADSAEPSPRGIARRLAHWQLAASDHSKNPLPDQTSSNSSSIERSDVASAPSLRTITSVVARYFSLRQSEIRGKSRRQSIVYARGIAMYLARNLTDLSLSRVGAEFGGRDHTTVLHACRKMADLTTHDAETRSTVAKLKRILLSN